MARLHFAHDWKNPNYPAIFQHRLDTLQKVRADKGLRSALNQVYKEDPIQFIIDWGCTTDPRNVSHGLPSVIPMLLFPRQIEFAQWILDLWRSGKGGLAEKSRDVGASWVSIGLSCALCNFHDDVVIGFGSRKEEYVDKLDSPKSLFWKARKFMSLLPPDFKNGWTEGDAPYMRIKFPHTRSIITGEAGDNIGRGDRTSIYFVDEAAYLDRPNLAEASLSATTNCHIDMSSVNGMNVFGNKRHSGRVPVFTFHWRDDPRKGEEWYAKQKEELSPVVVAQEIDLSYTASVAGIVIPQVWVQAAIGAFEKMGIPESGARRGALDVADEGVDKNAFAGGYGCTLDYLDEWSGKGDDIYGTVERAHGICHDQRYDRYYYDADGLGAGVRGDARKINESATVAVEAVPFRGSAAVINPDKPIPTAARDEEQRDKVERTNADMFANYKAQAWWDLRVRFQRTYRAVTEGHVYPVDELINLNPHMPMLKELCVELSQPTYALNGAGKILINKKPDGTKSPNKADAVMILFAPVEVRRSFFD